MANILVVKVTGDEIGDDSDESGDDGDESGDDCDESGDGISLEKSV